MFAKLLSAFLLALPFVSALTLDIPTNPESAGTVTLTWTASTQDPAFFSIELVNADFHNTYAIANNVQTALGSMTIQLPQVPAEGGYSLQAIAVNNVNQVLSQTGTFDITSTSSTSGSSTLTTPSTSATSSTPSVSLSSTPTVSTPISSFTPLSSSTSSTASSASPSTFSSGAAAFKLAGVAPAGAAVLAVVAGAAMVF